MKRQGLNKRVGLKHSWEKLLRRQLRSVLMHNRSPHPGHHLVTERTPSPLRAWTRKRLSAASWNNGHGVQSWTVFDAAVVDLNGRHMDLPWDSHCKL